MFYTTPRNSTTATRRQKQMSDSPPKQGLDAQKGYAFPERNAQSKRSSKAIRSLPHVAPLESRVPVGQSPVVWNMSGRRPTSDPTGRQQRVAAEETVCMASQVAMSCGRPCSVSAKSMSTIDDMALCFACAAASKRWALRAGGASLIELF